MNNQHPPQNEDRLEERGDNLRCNCYYYSLLILNGIIYLFRIIKISNKRDILNIIIMCT